MQNEGCQSKGRRRIISSGNSSCAGEEEEGLCAGSCRAARREEALPSGLSHAALPLPAEAFRPLSFSKQRSSIKPLLRI